MVGNELLTAIICAVLQRIRYLVGTHLQILYLGWRCYLILLVIMCDNLGNKFYFKSIGIL